MVNNRYSLHEGISPSCQGFKEIGFLGMIITDYTFILGFSMAFLQVLLSNILMF